MITGEAVITYIQNCPEETLNALRKEHRTNQQVIIKSLYRILRAYSISDTDIRNEAAVEWAKFATSKNHPFPFI